MSSFPPVSYAPKAFKLLQGVFAVYKPTGVPIKSLMKEVHQRIIADINSMEQLPQKQMIVFKPVNEVVENQISTQDKKFNFPADFSNFPKVPVLVTDWFDHPFVQGPKYSKNNFQLCAGHTLDVHACGVQVFSLQKQGEETLKRLNKLTLPRRYQAKGQFGLASSTYGTDSKIVEKSTWDHITEEKIDRVLSVTLGAHKNMCIKASGIDLSSQQAYNLASKGFLKPHSPTDDLILDMKLSSFKLPEFTIDITCINESCMFIRQMIHKIGLELKSTAICTHLQRQRDAVFTHTDEHTLLGHQINANSVINSVQHSKFLLDQGVLKRKRYFKRTRLNIVDRSKRLLTSNEHSLEKNNEQFYKLVESG